MRDLSIILPARNEIFLQRTIEDILENSRADTEIIAICDGYWPSPPVLNHPKVIIVHHTESIGQRAATNEGARISQAKYVMKADAHCAFDRGFDVKLMKDYEPDWTLVPLMYNLHAFDWRCLNCGDRTYQGVKPKECGVCFSGAASNFEMVIVWTPRWRRLTYSYRFDKNLRFQYWHKHRDRLETKKGAHIETMSFIGACFFISRDRYWELGGLDEKHGSWGQLGTEIACKSWLSGGKLLTSKKTWFSHMFRTGNFAGDSGPWPYPITTQEIEQARTYSKDFWLNNKWSGATREFQWLIDKFAPIPDWHD